jgi:hypothetical protein
MSNSGQQQNFIDFWQKVHEDLKFWYERADEKSTGIIALSGILLGFVTLSAVISKPHPGDTSLNIILFGFFFSVLGSVIIAISSLWSRVKFQGLRPSFENPPEIFFSYIAQLYHTTESNRIEQGNKYFNDEISKCKSNEDILKSMASEITILSSNLKNKYVSINRCYLFIFASIVLMGFYSLLKFLQ